MLTFNFYSSLIVTAIFLFAGVALIRRWQQVRDATLWGLIVSMFLLALAYLVFTYNAYSGLSNAPYQYWLRAFNTNLGLSVAWLSIKRHRDYIDLLAEQEKKLDEVRKEIGNTDGS